MKKITSLLCAAVMAVCTCVSVLPVQVQAAAAPTITISRVQAEPGASVQVPVTITGNTGICGAEVTVHYDNALVLTKTSSGAAFSGMNFTAPGDLSANPVHLLWDNTDAIQNNGEMAVLTFTAPAKSGTYNVSATIDDGNVVDGDLNPVHVTIVDGAITVGGTAPAGFRITEQPQDVQAGVNGTVSFSVKAEEATSYQWQYSKNGGVKWVNCSATGNKTESISLKVTASNSVNIYRCIVTGKDGKKLTSETAGVDLLPGVVITLNPRSNAVAVGEYATFTVETENAAAFQWQYSKDGAHWYRSNAEGNKTDTLIVKGEQKSQGNRYRCVVTGIDGNTKKSYMAAMIVMTVAPKNCTAQVGETASYTLKAEGIAEYQWQYSKDGGQSWYKSSAAGATTDTVTFTASKSNRAMIYRCKLTTPDEATAFTKPVGFE